MARFLRNAGSVYIVALDLSEDMLKINDAVDDRVVGVMEYLPFRNGSFKLVTAGFSIHASFSIAKALYEISRVGCWIGIVSIGRSSNMFKWLITLLYSYIAIPLFVLTVNRYLIHDFLNIFHIIVRSYPNRDLVPAISKLINIYAFFEKAFGAVYMIVGRSSIAITNIQRESTYQGFSRYPQRCSSNSKPFQGSSGFFIDLKHL